MGRGRLFPLTPWTCNQGLFSLTSQWAHLGSCLSYDIFKEPKQPKQGSPVACSMLSPSCFTVPHALINVPSYHLHSWLALDSSTQGQEPSAVTPSHLWLPHFTSQLPNAATTFCLSYMSSSSSFSETWDEDGKYLGNVLSFVFLHIDGYI